MATGNLSDDAALARDYWEAVAEHIPAWTRVLQGEMAASEVRDGYMHSHGIALQALGLAGNALLRAHPDDWRKRLGKLRRLDWSRSNARLWGGRVLVGGRVVKGNNNITLTANAIKHVLGLPLNSDESKVEEAHKRGFEAQETPVVSARTGLREEPRNKEVASPIT